MTKYLKTTFPPYIVENKLRYYLQMCSSTIVLPKKIVKYLRDEFKISFNEISQKLIRNIHVQKVNLSLISVEIIDEKIKDNKLSSLVNLLEYGNRDIPATGVISKMFNQALILTQNYLGGD